MYELDIPKIILLDLFTIAQFQNFKIIYEDILYIYIFNSANIYNYDYIFFFFIFFCINVKTKTCNAQKLISFV